MYRSMLVKGLHALLNGDHKLTLLRAAEVVLELREHVTHSRLRGINREAAFARACDVQLRAERQNRAVCELAVVCERPQQAVALAVDAHERGSHILIHRGRCWRLGEGAATTLV